VKAVAFDPYGDVTTLLDDVERKVGMTDATMSREGRMSSGLLTMDLILGGGYTAGWYTNFGQEQSCKTTQAVTTLFSSLAYDVPIRHYDDYEGSGGGAPDYLEAIMKNVTQGKHSNITDVFGIRDLKGKWVKKPIIRYRSEIVGETFFDFLSMLMRRLPDKKKIGDKWWFIYEDTKENRAKVGSEYDKNYFAETKRLRVPAPDGSLQAVIVLDSYPAMLPEKQDVDDPNSALAVQARMFSEQLRRVKGRVRSKRILIQGINQLRLKIGVMFGSPEFEPGGEALKLYSDVRNKFTSRAISAVDGAVGKGQIEEEESVDGEGVDTYRYIHVKNIKNKFHTPYLETFLRLWIRDSEGVAQGFDPVFDTFEYLRMTGQVENVKRKKIWINLAGKEKASKFIGWRSFKRLILGSDEEVKAICKKIGISPVRLRRFCQKQLASGAGLDLHFEQLKESAKKRVIKSAKAESTESEGMGEEV
jgi:hypothetical protein